MGIIQELKNIFYPPEEDMLSDYGYQDITPIIKLDKPKHEKFTQINKIEIDKKVKEHSEKFGLKPKEIKLLGNYSDFETTLQKDSLIILLIAGRGGGKTALGFRLLENIATLNKKRKCYVIGSNPLAFPSFIEPLESMEDAPNGAIVLIDEGALEYNARESMGKKAVNLTKIMAIARHKNITLIYITQNSAIGDKNVLRLCDVLIFKNSSLMQEETERKEIKNFYKKINPFFKSHDKKERKTISYIFSDDFCGFIKSGLPSFWNDNISKGYSETESNYCEKQEEIEE